MSTAKEGGQAPEEKAHPLSAPAHPSARRSVSYARLDPAQPGPSRSPALGQTGYFDNAHIASATAPRRKMTTEADLLGLVPSARLRSGSGTQTRATPGDYFGQANGSSNLVRPKTSRSSSRRSPLSSLSKEEMAVVEMRFEHMSDEEIATYLELVGGGRAPVSALATPRGSPGDASPSMPIPTPQPRVAQLSSSRDDSGSHSPLFPPSPPTGSSRTQTLDHPLRILSRAIRELKEEISQLEAENEILRLAQPQKSEKPADQASIHDGLTEALSTSLKSESPTKGVSLVPSSLRTNGSQSIRSASPAPSSRSARPMSPTPSLTPSFVTSPPTSYASSMPPTDTQSTPIGQRSKVNRASWTSGLWVWSGNKARRPRRGSGGSLASQATGVANIASASILEEAAIVGDDDDESWRKGDGGSSPAFRAIFLATRIITPDPSSILVSSSISPKSLVAYLAHSLVSNARDEELSIREPPGRRRSSGQRSRATSVAAPDVPSAGLSTPTKERGYGDQALAATANLGRTLLSSVSTATMRAKAMGDDMSRPSLLSRVSSSRPPPTTALVAPDLAKESTSSLTSPLEEAPPPTVELSSIIPDEARPPTLLLSRQNLGSYFQSSRNIKTLTTASRFKNGEEPLTDRYGFIYDIQHASMLKDAGAVGAAAAASLTGTVPLPRTEEEGWIARRRRETDARSTKSETSPRPSIEESEISPRPSIDSGVSAPTKAQAPQSDMSTRTAEHRSRSLTGPSLRVNSPGRPVTAKDHLTVSARGASSLHSEISHESSTSPISLLAPSPKPPAANESRKTVSSLLDRLTEIHDAQQKERTVEWDAFLRKRTKHRRELPNGKVTTDDLRWGSTTLGLSQLGLSKTGQDEWKVFTSLVRKGIPLVYRSDIWAECSGAKDLMVPGEYQEILKVHEGDVNPFAGEIEKDVSRTFPGNVFFGGDGPGVAKLRRVLVAYSWHNPAVGYCQGMNMLAATLLLTHSDEEQAYWVLLCIIERLLPTDFFSPSLLASRADQAVLQELAPLHVPKVVEKLEELGVDLTSLTFGWFLSLFTDCLPVETLFRVWDVFFVEGHPSLFRIAIAILKLAEGDIASCDTVSDLFALVNSVTARLWSADKLIGLQHSLRSTIKSSDIAARCHRHILALQPETPGSD